MTIITELDAFDIDHNNLIDPHVTLPREKKEGMLEKYIWLTTYDYISIRVFRFNYNIEKREENIGSIKLF